MGYKYLLKYKDVSKLQQKRGYLNGVPLAQGYNPKEVETLEKIPKMGKHSPNKLTEKASFRMILPPPNVTGDLHLGHALMATVQDVICRHRRQLGYKVEWIPGTDHAGIATQVVLEKKLLKNCGLNRHQLGRKKFLEEVWRWKQEKSASIMEDLRKLGCTLKWDEEYFTLDERQAKAVNLAFVKLFDDGLIKRKNSLVNWSCSLESAISDIEVETLELKGPTPIRVPGYKEDVLFGRIYDINYHLFESDAKITVSTTRPETLLGDVAVAVHPDDERYLKYKDMGDVKLWHPFRSEHIPLIFDSSVDRGFGTGAVKLTPAHDRNDFDVAQRHSLKPITVFTNQGTISENFAYFSGLPRFEARQQILSALSEKQLLHSVKDHAMSLPICSRSKDVIEYMLRPQWFLNCQSMADDAISEVRSGRLKIVPSNFETEWYRWLEQCHDWCISRQLWWGHQVPAYFAKDTNGNSCWVAAHDEEEALEKAQKVLNSRELDVEIERDSDVLDTWFSSGILPLSICNWPNLEYKQRYPFDLMETGHDILFFWVARMTMLSLQLTGQKPFKTILLNGIVCDAHGRKMSKSLGNVVTPQQVIQGATIKSLQEAVEASFSSGILSENELQKSLKGLRKMFPNGIEECGTDALRFTLCSHNIKNHFINFDVAECYRNKLFLNKIWQATRYTLGSSARLNISLHEIESISNEELNKWDQWILSRLADTLKTCFQGFEAYNLHTATAVLKTFLYNSLCDVYLETTKGNINVNSHGSVQCATLATCLSWALQAMSPFTPFISEELLKHLPKQVQLDLDKYYNRDLEKEISAVLDVCHSIRQLKSRNNISKKHEPRVNLYAHTSEAWTVLKPHLTEIQMLTSTRSVDLHEVGTEKTECSTLSSAAGHLCSFGIVTNDIFKSSAIDPKQHAALNKKNLQKLEAQLLNYRARVLNDGFQKSASEQVKRKHIEKMQELQLQIDNIKAISS